MLLKSKIINLISLVIITSFLNYLYGNVHLVPQNHETIQAAINQAEDEDTILVALGRYMERIVIDNDNASNLLLTGSPEMNTNLVGIEELSWFSGIWSFGLCLLVSTPNTEVHILHTSNNGFSRHKGVYRPVCFATFFMLGEDSFPKHVSPFR